MKPISLYSLMILLLLTASCQQRMYFPDRANTPGFTEAYEAKLAMAWKPQSNVSDSGYHNDNGQAGFGADLAFSPVNHLGILASYRSINNRRIHEDESANYTRYGGEFNGHRWEGGIGYFTAFGRLGKFELYAGYGRGEISRRGIYTPERDYRTGYDRFFLQPALGLGNNIFSATGGVRIAYQRYSGFSSPNPDLRYTILGRDEHEDAEGATAGFIEPFVNAEVGWKYIKFNAQAGCTGQIFGGNVSGSLPFYCSLGFVLHFAPRYLTEKPSPRQRRRGR